jgi:hypothetical protein
MAPAIEHEIVHHLHTNCANDKTIFCVFRYTILFLKYILSYANQCMGEVIIGRLYGK